MSKAIFSIKSILLSLDFFAKLDKIQIDLIASISKLNIYDKGYILYYEKQINYKLLFLVSGGVKSYKIDKHNNEIFLYHIHSSTLISEISDLSSSHIISYSNVSLSENSQILSIDYKKFKELFLDTNILFKEFTNEIISRSNQLSSLIDRELIFDAVAKVAMMLDSDLDIFNKIKRAEVSLILHIQPETLSRVLNRLKRNKIIETNQGKILILDNIALKKIFEEQYENH